MALNLANDIALMDGLATVSLVARGETAGVEISALRRDINTREAAASNGRYLTADVRFHWQFTDSDAENVPSVGDSIIDVDGTWTILEVGLATLRTRWACVCRNLAIQSGLGTLIKIQKATWAKDSNGSQVATWADLYTSVPARIQPVMSDETSDKRHLRNQDTYEVFTTSAVIVSKDHRIVGSDNKVYRITGLRNPERVDQLLTILCEEWVQ
jgi:head-tail adaptor